MADEQNSLSDCSSEDFGDCDSSIASSVHNGDKNKKAKKKRREEEEIEQAQEEVKEPDETAEIREQLALKENEHVFRLRMLVFVVLLLAAGAVSIVVFYITTKAQVSEFQTQYSGVAKQVTEAFKGIVLQKLGAISALGVAAIAHGVDHERTWPFVTLSSFQQRSATAQSLSKSLYVGIAPFVNDTIRDEWEQFVTEPENSNWISEGYDYQEILNLNQLLQPSHPGDDQELAYNISGSEKYSIMYVNTDPNGYDVVIPDPGPGPYMPIWQTSPVLRRNTINHNMFRHAVLRKGLQTAWESQSIVIGRMDISPPGTAADSDYMTSFYSAILSIAAKQPTAYMGDPMSTIYLPVFDSFDPDTRYPAAILFAVIRWATYFEKILPAHAKGIDLVLYNSCDGSYTYRIDGPSVTPVGYGDLHDPGFNYLVQSSSYHGTTNIADGTETGLPLYQDKCHYEINVYPSQAFKSTYTTSTPIVITFCVALIFVFTAFMFLIYDRLVERRQQLIMRKAVQSSVIVSSLFPKNVRDRLLQDTNHVGKSSSGLMAPNHRLKSYLKGDANENDLGLQPIADLFPNTTVLFADISGFTAWSSTRDPAQVFILLQTVYQAFDNIANQRKVFKVETIGDSYVAVTGLPEPQENHAIIMSRFAGECMICMNDVVKELEMTLGPDTADLCMRMGIHSGPVTAGVLRGERSRFQLFGDTVNTAARMESTGVAGRIQVSQATADLLIVSGKEHWLKPRKDAVQAKGKGVLSTFWLVPTSRKASPRKEKIRQDAAATVDAPAEATEEPVEVLKQDRLVNWIVELLADHLKQLVAKRLCAGGLASAPIDYQYKPEAGKMSLNEVAEVIHLPKFDAKAVIEQATPTNVIINPVVMTQLRYYVSTIAGTYRDNPFHNFEHACHVTMAVNKFLKRIVAPDIDAIQQDSGLAASQLHDYTHGINSDPLAHFAIVLSALIHDADHRGVSNAQLIKEDEQMAKMYQSKSVAEQNSLDLSWDLLMSAELLDLRKCLFSTPSELQRFRQIVVNVVLATDIFDKELNDLRKARWNKAFVDGETCKDNDLRATIVIEHIIQASDVAHTMQHWHIYRKWNKRLFTELFVAHRAGRMGMDPSTFWYKGELGFFDNYIIPLAKKLKDCNVFGVSSDECLNYALKNRLEWEERGNDIVEQMREELAQEYAVSATAEKES